LLSFVRVIDIPTIAYLALIHVFGICHLESPLSIILCSAAMCES
jgi:hypothetical protein